MRKFPYISIMIIAIALAWACGNGNGTTDKNGTDTVVVNTVDADRYAAMNTRIKANPNDPWLYYERAGFHFEDGVLEDADNDLDRAIKIDPDIPEFYILKADVAYQRKDTRMARDLLQFAIDMDDQNIEARMRLAEIYLQVSLHDEAIQTVNDVLRIDVNHAEAYFLKGMTYKYMGDTALAVSSMLTATEQDPELYNAWMQLGLIHAASHMGIAEAYLDNAIKLKPTSIEAIYAKCMFLQGHGNAEKALEGYDLILKIDPSYLLAHFNKGYCYAYYLKDFDLAIENYNRAIALYPAYFEAYNNRGVAYECLDKKDKAEEDYRQALKIQPDYTPAAKGLGRVVDGDYDPDFKSICS